MDAAKKQYAFLLMGGGYDPSRHCWQCETDAGISCLYTVRDADEARRKVVELARDGFGAIELCGAFGHDLARELITLTGGKVAIGHVVHDADQDALFDRFFSPPEDR